MKEDALGQRPSRGPLKFARVLLPIWGYRYVRQFLDLGLPTWLAAGNLPAVAEAVPTEFVLLTGREDASFVKHHPNFERLQQICPVSFHYIDHLIVSGSYSTTITLAYTEAVRAMGEDMLDTCFFFLVSDYIVANHSFRNALQRIIDGRSAVLVGNFQVSREEAMPWLVKKLHRVRGALSLTARELMCWGLSNLHPATVANTINYALNHNDHTNRLFWRVDNLTLIGRFYLMHMICIRPETTDFFIGASCDYSFVPEMCPGDDVAIIQDSDEYLVIEMQPRAHEADALRERHQTVAGLARALSKWTTARHRKNAESTVVFHAGDLSPALPETVAEADRFVASVRRRLTRPSPFRGHHYWRGALAAFKEATGLRLSARELRMALGFEHPNFSRGPLGRWLFEKLDFLIIRRPRYVSSWDPWGPDHKLIMKHLTPFVEGGGNRLLIVGQLPSFFSTTLPDGGERVLRLQTNLLLQNPPDYYAAFTGFFDACLLEVHESELKRAGDLIDRLAPMMKPDSTLLLSVYSRASGFRQFKTLISFEAARMIRPTLASSEFWFVKTGRLRLVALQTLSGLVRLVRKRPLVGVPVVAMIFVPLVLAILVGSWFCRVAKDKLPRGGISSFLMVSRLAKNHHLDAYSFSEDQTRDEPARLRYADSDHKRAGLVPNTELGQRIDAVIGGPRPSSDTTLT